MRNPIPGQIVRYTGGFPEFEGELWDIVTVFPMGDAIFGPEVEVFGRKTWRLLRKSSVDFALEEDTSGRVAG